MALIEREKKTKNSKKNYKIQNPKILLKLLLGREKKLKITKKLQNTKSKNTVKTPVEEIYFYV